MSINIPLKVDNLFCTPVYSLLMPTFFNSYLTHQYALDAGIDPFRFVHFNIQCFKPYEENV